METDKPSPSPSRPLPARLPTALVDVAVAVAAADLDLSPTVPSPRPWRSLTLRWWTISPTKMLDLLRAMLLRMRPPRSPPMVARILEWPRFL